MNKRMKFSDLIDRVARQSGHSRHETHDFLKSLVDAARYGLAHDGRVSIGGVGVFDLRHQDARMGRNPQTGDALEIPEHYRVHYHPDAAMRRFINRQYSHLKPRLLPGASAALAGGKPSDVEASNFFDKRNSSEYGRDNRKPVITWLVIAALILLLFIFVLPLDNPAPELTVNPVDTKTNEAAVPADVMNSVQPIEKSAVQPLQNRVHSVKSGDKLWGLARQYYQNPHYWPCVYQANEKIITNPDQLNAGMHLEIPALASSWQAMGQTEKQMLAEGYMKAYYFYQKQNRADAFTCLWAARYAGGDAVIQANRHKIPEADLERMTGMRLIKPVLEEKF